MRASETTTTCGWVRERLSCLVKATEQAAAQAVSVAEETGACARGGDTSICFRGFWEFRGVVEELH